jgi:hypothetical protein
MSNVTASVHATGAAAPKLRLGGRGEGLADAFVIRPNFWYHPPAVTMPEPPFPMVHADERLEAREFTRSYHAALFERTGGLTLFHEVANACAHALRLAQRAFLRARDCLHPTTFAKNQRVCYAHRVYDAWIGKTVRDAVAVDDVDEVLRSRLLALARSGATSCGAVLGAAVDCVNATKQRFNEKFPGKKQALCQPDPENDVPLCEYFCRAADGLASAAVFAFVSQVPVDIPPPPRLSKTRLRNPKLTDLVIESLTVPRFLVEQAQATWQRNGMIDGRLGVGTRLLLFLEIYERLAPVVFDPGLTKAGRPDPAQFLGTAFNGVDLTQFAAALMQAWSVLEPLYQDQFRELPGLSAVGNPVTFDLVVPMTRLLVWFGVWVDVPPEYEALADS